MKKHQYKYDLIFDGKIRNGFTYENVTQLLKDQVKLDEVQITELFSGRVRVCKNADYNTVLQIHKKFFALGLELKLQLQARPEPNPVERKSVPQPSDSSHEKVKKKPVAPQKLTAQSIAKAFSQGSSSYVRRASGIVGFSAVLATTGGLAIIYAGVFGGLSLLLYRLMAAVAKYSESGMLLLSGGLLTLLACVLLFAFLKPFLAHYQARRRRCLDSHAHPKLHILLQALCGYLGAPYPHKIYVDQYPGVSVLLQNNLTGVMRRHYSLVIGMPLFAVLNARQLAAVLTEALGVCHNRLLLLAQQLFLAVNEALYQRAYLRDSWDKRLEEFSRARVFPLALVGRSLIFCTIPVRYFIRLLHLFAKLSSSPFLRIIKQDAVELQCRVIGYQAYKHLLLETNKLILAWDKVNALNTALRERNRLLENIPVAVAAYIKHHETSLNQQVRDRGDPRLQTELSPGALSLISRSSKGIFLHQNPAKEFISHFEELSCYVTEQHYLSAGLCESAIQLLAVEQVPALAPGRKASEHTLDIFFNGLYNGRRFLMLDKEYSREIALLTHQKLVDHLRWKSLDFKHALDMYEDRLIKLRRMDLGKEYLKAGIRFNLAAYHLKKQTFSSAVREIALMESKLEENNQTLAAMDSVFKRRFELCYRVMNNADKQKFKSLLSILSVIQLHDIPLIQLERNVGTLNALLEERDKSLRARMNPAIEHYRLLCSKLMNLMLVRSDNVFLPSTWSDSGSLGAFLRTRLGDDVEDMQHMDDRQCAGYGGLLVRLIRNKYSQLLAMLAELCIQQEKNQGIKPLRLVSS